VIELGEDLKLDLQLLIESAEMLVMIAEKEENLDPIIKKSIYVLELQIARIRRTTGI